MDCAIFEPDPPKSADALGYIATQIESSEKAWKDYLALPFSMPEEERIAGKAGRQRSLIVKGGIDGAIDAFHHGDKDVTRVLALEEILTQFRVYAEQSDRLDAIQEEASLAAYVALQSFFNGLLRTFGLMIAIGLALAAGCYVVFSRAISHPFAEILVHFHEISGSNLITDMRIHSCDEMGLLMEGLQQMQAKLKETVVTVCRDSESIASATQRITAGNTNPSQRTEEQANSLEETASSMEELTSTVKQNADNVCQMSTLAVNASEIAIQGSVVVQNAMTTMGETSESLRKTTSTIAMIKGIAPQINTLALSTTVEVVCAGEQGRGSAVVAGEVHTLAQRSAGVTREIKSLIEDSAMRIKPGSTLVTRAGKTMEEIVMAMKRMTDIMDEISASSAEQSIGIEQINEAVTQMDDMTQQSTAPVEEVAATAQALEEQTDELRRVTVVFHMTM